MDGMRRTPNHTTSPDFVVIGGGVCGTAAAAFLANEGAAVTLYEREALAAGASGRNSGYVGHPFDASLVPLYRETLSLYKWLVDDDRGTWLPRDPTGVLFVSEKREVPVALVAELSSAYPDLPARVVEADELGELVPHLAAGLSACLIEAGHPIAPSASTYALASLAERRGAAIRVGRAARPRMQGRRVVGVEIEGRFQPTGAVLVAAGPWTPEVIDPTGTWRPIRPLWGVVVETRLADPPVLSLVEAEMDEVRTLRDEARTSDLDSNQSVSPTFSLFTAGGLSLVGSTFLDQEPDPHEWAVPILERASRFVPALDAAPIRSVHACARPYTSDGRPLVGLVPGADGLFVCAGHGMWGISTGPASARMVSDLMLGKPVQIPVEHRADRFGGPRFH